MTPSELQRRVKAALELLSDPVTKDYREYDGVYPHIVYREISNVPALHGDNREIFFRAVYQVTIVTSDDNYEELKRDYLALVITIVDIANGAAYLFDKETETNDRNWKAELELEQYRSILERDKKQDGETD